MHPGGWQPTAGREALLARARLLAQIRRFFAERGVLEVETPLLASHTVTDPFIEPFAVSGAVLPAAVAPGGKRYLQTSPEYAMKRLLAAGSGPIYQLCKAFRDDECGARHNPEFTLLEWYRPGFDEQALMDEVEALLGACLGRVDSLRLSYAALFEEVLGLDPHRATARELEQRARAEVDVGALRADRDTWLDLLLTHCIEPELAHRGIVGVHDFPASQAALACTREVDGVQVARRFEFYVDGVELANGYFELRDPVEQRRRFAADNTRRVALDRPQREPDPFLLAALEAGLPECSGVALGVDRLLMVAIGAASLAEVLSFSWQHS